MINGHGAQELCCSTCVPTHDALHQAAHPRRSPCAHTPQSGAASRLTRPASHGRASRRMSCTQELHGTLLLRVGCRDEPHDAKGSRRATSAPASLPSRLAARGHRAAELGPERAHGAGVCAARTGANRGGGPLRHQSTPQGASKLCEAPPSSTASRATGRRPAACPAVGGMGLASSPSPFDAPDSAGRYALAKLPCGACAAASPHVVSELVQVARLEDVGELQACAANRAKSGMWAAEGAGAIAPSTVHTIIDTRPDTTHSYHPAHSRRVRLHTGQRTAALSV